ncbi:cysteine desulfurase [Sulfurimonas sp.]|uniref:cysteine desulfurase n=1 Tax=Sulfurimonas sp. TaxID=2022749 RepID=UPI002AB241EF|nr:cysteine desulfurase [Sulfurimonas sp.]
MYKLNSLNYAQASSLNISKDLSIQTLSSNIELDKLKTELKNRFNFSSIHSFSFCKSGFLGLMLEIREDIAVSLGESEAIIEAAKEYEKLGFGVSYIDILKDGNINYDTIKSCSNAYMFISAYIIDTFVKIDLKKVKNNFNGKIISNISPTLDASFCNIAYFDIYKLSGYFTHSVLLHNDVFEEQNISSIDAIGLKIICNETAKEKETITYKNSFIKELRKSLKDDIFFFVDNNLTLTNVVHFGLKGIKARQVIRNLSLANIFVTNGEGCSLGLSKPSRILQEMGYCEIDSRQAFSLSFCQNFNEEQTSFIVSKISKSYRQIKALNG